MGPLSAGRLGSDRRVTPRAGRGWVVQGVPFPTSCLWFLGAAGSEVHWHLLGWGIERWLRLHLLVSTVFWGWVVVLNAKHHHRPKN